MIGVVAHRFELLSYSGSVRFELADQRVDAPEPRFGERFADFAFEPRQLFAIGIQPLRRIDRHQRRSRADHDAVQSIEVALADGIEFVIMAAGARDRHAQERLRDYVDLVVGETHLLVERVGRGVAVLHHTKVPQAEHRLVQPELAIDAWLRRQIAGQVLDDEPVIRHVVVEGTNQVVAVPPRKRNRRVPLAPVRFGVAEPVHPMPGPAFTEAGRIEIAVDQRFVRARRWVVDESLDFFGRGGQAGQHE